MVIALAIKASPSSFSPRPRRSPWQRSAVRPSIFLLANPLPPHVTETINSVTQTHSSHKERQLWRKLLPCSFSYVHRGWVRSRRDAHTNCVWLLAGCSGFFVVVACSVHSPPCQLSKGFKRLFCVFFIDKPNFISIALLSRYRGIGSLK